MKTNARFAKYIAFTFLLFIGRNAMSQNADAAQNPSDTAHVKNAWLDMFSINVCTEAHVTPKGFTPVLSAIPDFDVKKDVFKNFSGFANANILFCNWFESSSVRISLFNAYAGMSFKTKVGDFTLRAGKISIFVDYSLFGETSMTAPRVTTQPNPIYLAAPSNCQIALSEWFKNGYGLGVGYVFGDAPAWVVIGKSEWQKIKTKGLVRFEKDSTGKIFITGNAGLKFNAGKFGLLANAINVGTDEMGGSLGMNYAAKFGKTNVKPQLVCILKNGGDFTTMFSVDINSISFGLGIKRSSREDGTHENLPVIAFGWNGKFVRGSH